ncbi:hypothetical protein VDS18_08160 [Xanthomonas campestris pv. campestris]|uniref:hypothetical protein n=1 Tax=Xanthomonas sp. fls2-241-TYG-148 TaxID=3040328 RepID=UPI0025578D3F|nr:hypothetical protein [Xanthomonas sp. fls2-241-TYG-148]MEB2185866.1 hypothetical protein [Xanthomonas campestris pv. campestris]
MLMIATDAVVADAVKWGELVMPAGGGVVARARMSEAECDSSHLPVASKKIPTRSGVFMAVAALMGCACAVENAFAPC